MFKKLKGQYAKEVAKQVEAMTLDVLNQVNPQTSAEAEATESLHRISGNRKALFIGINYKGQKGELRGCVNDVVNIKEFFQKHYPLDDMMILTDDKETEPETNFAPTKKNILSAFRWLVRGARKGDSLLLHYSGHGGKVKNKDGTEKSGYDQTVVPLDFQSAGQIIDDDVHDALCKGLPEGVRLTAIFDCCHSESIMDLPYIYNVNGNLEIVENDRNAAISKLVAGGTRLFLDRKNKKAMMNFGKDIMGIVKDAAGGKDGRSDDAKQEHVEANTTDADIIMFSGCKDMQTSADANIAGEATGAMSYALIRTLKRHLREKITYTDLLREMRETLEGKYTQVPMLSAGRRLKLDQPFTI
mmetsp:Transcript_6227/g.15130  ORF Transcript_6227/g.15130 Transcript_6227/m.15130 type:complete len:357 (+) Transcript_6227:211-1281(+)